MMKVHQTNKEYKIYCLKMDIFSTKHVATGKYMMGKTFIILNTIKCIGTVIVHILPLEWGPAH